MIERYSLPEMAKIWDSESRFNFWLQVEIAVCEAYAELGKISQEDLNNIKNKARFDVNRINEIEEEVKHDVIAFLTCLSENIGESSRFVHMGMTSSDMIDTAFALQIASANEILLDKMDKLLKVLSSKAIEYKKIPMIGRSHGIHAEPTTMGLKFALWYDIFSRNLKRLKTVAEEIRVGQISGAVGTYANIDPQIEEITCSKLGLEPSNISTQVIQRDIHANYIQVLALIASSIDLIATEIRNLQRTDVLEVEEGFAKGQKGSSAMPHKKNPIASENLCGLARILRSNSIAALENVPLWHERDISHSSVERVIFPDSTILLDYMITRLTNVLTNLKIYPENMKENMNIYGGVIFSQQMLLKLIDKGITREKAYDIVQRNAHAAWNKPDGDFKKNILKDPDVINLLSVDEIVSVFNSEYHLKQVDYIFEKLGLNQKCFLRS